MFVQNFNKWFSLVPNKMFVLVECCENSAADSTSLYMASASNNENPPRSYSLPAAWIGQYM